MRGASGREEKPTDVRGAELWGAARHPQPRAAFWDVVKAQLRFGRWYIKIFCVQENGGMVRARSKRERATGEPAAGVASYSSREGLRLLCSFNLFTLELE